MDGDWFNIVIPALMGIVSFFFVRWMKGVEQQLEKHDKNVVQLNEKFGDLEKCVVNSTDCYLRYVRVRQAFERDRFRLHRLEELNNVTSPHPAKNQENTQ